MCTRVDGVRAGGTRTRTRCNSATQEGPRRNILTRWQGGLQTHPASVGRMWLACATCRSWPTRSSIPSLPSAGASPGCASASYDRRCQSPPRYGLPFAEPAASERSRARRMPAPPIAFLMVCFPYGGAWQVRCGNWEQRPLQQEQVRCEFRRRCEMRVARMELAITFLVRLGDARLVCGRRSRRCQVECL